MPGTSKPRRRDAVAPERMYPLAAFQELTGIGPTRMREARIAGVFLTTIDVGRRKFVRGEDGIAYIEQLAELSARSTTAK